MSQLRNVHVTPGTGQQRALAASRSDRDRALEAMQALEAATGAAGPGRDEEWRTTVIGAFRHLQDALAEQTAAYANPASLMKQAAQDDPRLRTLVRQLHHRWSDLEATAETLARELQDGHAADEGSIATIREQVRWLMTALHHHRAREADIIFEALGVDLAHRDDHERKPRPAPVADPAPGVAVSSRETRA